MVRHQNDVAMPLRLHYPAAFDGLVDLLRGAGLNTYDVIAQCTGPNEGGDIAVSILYGSNYAQRMEEPFDESSLRTLDAKVLAFFQQVAKSCYQQNTAEYQTFMRRTKP
ncbi:hypothetical protein [Alicyclobacillus mengziensis]|uniref:Uncharacterized protein n=1 Tax=Alicyclobacillus mengziensis TaxID=2931921 RepID=A0A9X7VXI1_9BACL|nr:hypothetical protein [Alicyclobacillus mengziensis]QSO45578.1 hypothetical protein JZ786_13475 [Alicyclobacillus mengziensis]